MSPIQRYPEGRLLTVECRRSHVDKPAVIATFQEGLFEDGSRSNLDLLNSARRTRAGVEVIKHHRPHVDIGANSGGEIVRDERPSPAVMHLVGTEDDVPLTDWRGDSRPSRVHIQLRCPICALNVSRRWETVRPVLEKLIDGGVSSIDLKRLDAILNRQ